ncbi:MAG: hypothetical protein AAGI34_18510, partial [Pseudomonadota bacterium]
ESEAPPPPPPVIVEDEAARRGLPDAFEDIDGITFFITETLEESGLEIVTGAAFASPEAVLDSKAERIWCYVNLRDGATVRQITLGTALAGEAAVFADPKRLEPDLLDALGVSREALAKAAREHCRFADFDPAAAS